MFLLYINCHTNQVDSTFKSTEFCLHVGIQADKHAPRSTNEIKVDFDLPDPRTDWESYQAERKVRVFLRCEVSEHVSFQGHVYSWLCRCNLSIRPRVC